MDGNKASFCERCSREINHKGRCLPCNYLYKHRKYFPGLMENPDYDIKQGIDTNMVKDLVEKKEDPELVKNTLEDFSRDSKKAKSKGHSNGKLEEGLKNLEEAKGKSSEGEKKEIEEALKKLEEGKDD